MINITTNNKIIFLFIFYFFIIVEAKYAKNAGINGRTQGLKNESNPAKNAIPKFSDVPKPTPPTFNDIRIFDANGKLAIRDSWLVKTNIPIAINITPKT